MIMILDINWKILSDLKEIPYQYLLQDGLNTDLLVSASFYFYDMYRANMLLIELKKYFELKEKISSLVNEASYFCDRAYIINFFPFTSIHSGLLDINKPLYL